VIHGKNTIGRVCILAFELALAFGTARTETIPLILRSSAMVGQGWHPWYEVKADPENTENLIICGTKWDSRSNSPFGFVYSSDDGGTKWELTLEDKGSAWVTEQSCAFGPHHTAYLVSGDSKVVDGIPHHDEGKTHVFVSTDAGQHWTRTITTGWADYSTSAFSINTGRLYTFYNAWYTTHKPGTAVGGAVGLLLFSKDGRRVSGPFIERKMKTAGYHGVFPVDAIELKRGAVVALYSAKRETNNGWMEDLGIVRANWAGNPSLTSVVIAHPSMDADCFNFSDASMTYDPTRNELFVAYVDGCNAQSRIALTTSFDEGKTWTQIREVLKTDVRDKRLYYPTLLSVPLKGIGLLWEEGIDRRNGNWHFSYLPNQGPVENKIDLSEHSNKFAVLDDSLWTAVQGTEDRSLQAKRSPTLTLTVLSELNNVWRGQGLSGSGDHIVAVWPLQDGTGQELSAGILGDQVSEVPKIQEGSVKNGLRNVGQQTVLLFAGRQHFDEATGSLQVCLMLANRGATALDVPIELKVERIQSPMGEVSITDASNGLGGVGAVWDITSAVTGDRIPPESTTNAFCPSFRLRPSAILASKSDELVVLEVKVLASSRRSLH
jgi:hypothetical protein